MIQKPAWARALLTLSALLAVFAAPGSAFADGGGFALKDVPATSPTASPAAAPVQYTLNVQLFEIDAEVEVDAVATVTSSPAGIVCQDNCSQAFTEGTVVTLTLTDGDATDWTGCDSSSDNQCAVTMNSDKSVVVAITPVESQVQGAQAERKGQLSMLGVLLLATFLGLRTYRKRRMST